MHHAIKLVIRSPTIGHLHEITENSILYFLLTTKRPAKACYLPRKRNGIHQAENYTKQKSPKEFRRTLYNIVLKREFSGFKRSFRSLFTMRSNVCFICKVLFRNPRFVLKCAVAVFALVFTFLTFSTGNNCIYCSEILHTKISFESENNLSCLAAF